MRYYRTPLPKVLLQLIGEFSGSDRHKLRFSITPKRKFLGPIYKCSHHGNIVKEKRLKQSHWIPVQLATRKDIEKIREFLCMKNLFVRRHGVTKALVECMIQIETLLTEVQNYALSYN